MNDVPVPRAILPDDVAAADEAALAVGTSEQQMVASFGTAGGDEVCLPRWLPARGQQRQRLSAGGSVLRVGVWLRQAIVVRGASRRVEVPLADVALQTHDARPLEVAEVQQDVVDQADAIPPAEPNATQVDGATDLHGVLRFVAAIDHDDAVRLALDRHELASGGASFVRRLRCASGETQQPTRPGLRGQRADNGAIIPLLGKLRCANDRARHNHARHAALDHMAPGGARRGEALVAEPEHMRRGSSDGLFPQGHRQCLDIGASAVVGQGGGQR
mmetsp:Transcript_42968/g.124259  ORF Transcript_42968/g.124259 Transcript_42968/m.124259 type:complete len:274 (+) Transcript_42968:810-1631(+)